MSEKASLTVTTNRDELKNIATFVEDMGNREDWPFELVFKVNLALEEVGLNVMDYGHDEGVHEIDIFLTSDEEAITIEVIDDGKPFDPLNDAPEADTDSSLKERRVGGLGLHLVRTTMDDLSYKREHGKKPSDAGRPQDLKCAWQSVFPRLC